MFPFRIPIRLLVSLSILTRVTFNIDKGESNMVSHLRILDAIKDDKSLVLLNSIATQEDSDTAKILAQLNFSRKEYYLRISKFVKTGVIRRRHRKYVLTPFGKIIYELHLVLVQVINLKLKDSLIWNPFAMQQ